MRITIATIGFIAVFIALPWLSAASVLALSARWRAWEVLLIGAVTDILWLPSDAFYGIPLATLFSLTVLLILEPLRGELLIGR